MAAVPSSGRAKVTLPTDEQILITREFDAPKHLVYEACTTPELIRRWWAGKRGEVTVADVDLRVGGAWRYVMVADRGFEVAFHGEYREIVPNERIVITEIYEGAAEAGAALNTVTFTEADGRTTLSILVECAEQGSARHDHRLRHGGRHAGGDGPPRADRDLASLSTRPRATTTGNDAPGWSRRSRCTREAPGTRCRATSADVCFLGGHVLSGRSPQAQP